MTGIIVPRPVALVSTIDRDGVRQSGALQLLLRRGLRSADGAVLPRPARRRRRSGRRPPDAKDTLRNVEETGEFVINVVSEAIAAAANTTAAEVASEVDEFELSGLTPIPSEVVRPPRVAESPAQMECKLLQVIYTTHAPGGGVIVLGEVVRFHRARGSCSKTFASIRPGLDAVGRMAGNTWVRTRDRIELVWLKWSTLVLQASPETPSS